MSNHDTSKGESGILVFSGVVCLGLAAGLLYFFSGQAEPIEEVDQAWFESPEVSIDAAELERSRLSHYGAESAGDADAFVTYRLNYQDANQKMFGEITRPEAQLMLKGLVLSANDALVEIQEHEKFTLIGVPIFANCNAGLAELLDDIVDGRVTMDDALDGNLGDDYRLYKQNCGHVMPTLRDHELVTVDGEWRRPQYGPLLFDVLQRWRFAAQVGDRVQPADGVSPADYRAWMEWRLLVPESFSPSERYEKLNLARRKPPKGLNLDRAEAFIAAAAGDWNRSRKAYNSVCESRAATAQDHEACRWLSRFNTDADAPEPKK